MTRRPKKDCIRHEVESFLEKHGSEARWTELKDYFSKQKASSPKSTRGSHNFKRKIDGLQRESNFLGDTCAAPWLKKKILNPMIENKALYTVARLGKNRPETWYILTEGTKEYLKLAKAWAKMEQTTPLFQDVNPGILAYSHLTRAWQIARAQEDADESPKVQKIWRALEEDGGYVDNVYEKLPKGAELIASTKSEEERKQRETFYKETGGVITVDFPPSLEDDIARASAFEKACLVGVAAAKQVREELESQLKKRKDKELESSS